MAAVKGPVYLLKSVLPVGAMLKHEADGYKADSFVEFPIEVHAPEVENPNRMRPLLPG